AVLASASVVGPGSGSAKSNDAVSSRWQKYCERKSSGRHTTRAPRLAASRMRSAARRRFSSGSAEQAIWIRPTVYLCEGCIYMSLHKSPRFAKMLQEARSVPADRATSKAPERKPQSHPANPGRGALRRSLCDNSRLVTCRESREEGRDEILALRTESSLVVAAQRERRIGAGSFLFFRA